jgi:glycosyltransferase involved in cell wall biosynthesis
MKIGMFHLGFFYSGGGEKLVLEELRGLRAMGHEVVCYAPYVDREGCYPDVPEMAEIQPILPPPPSWLPMKDPIWVALSCLLIPFMAGRFRDFDLFYGANQPGPWFAYVLSKLLKKPYVIYLAQPLRILHPRQVDLENGIRIREGDHRFLIALKRLGGKFVDKADRISVENADIVLTNGGYVGAWIKQVYGIESRDCPAGCHPIPEKDLGYEDRWDGVVNVNGREIKKPYVLLTNRHSPMKRFEYALWVHKEVTRSVDNLSMVITGQETEYTDRLREMVDDLNLNGEIHFVGLVNEEELGRLYRQATLYVYPSPEEDFGMGVIEAMAAGTPVVAWDRAGPTVTVRHGETGFLVTPYEIREFASRVLGLATDPVLVAQLGRAAHAHAKEFFTYERHLRILEQALLEALDEPILVQASESAPVSAPEWVQR